MTAETVPEPSEAAPAQVSAVSDETPDPPKSEASMSEAPTRPAQTSLESKPDAGSAPPGALRAFYGRSKDLAAGIFKEVSWQRPELGDSMYPHLQLCCQPVPAIHFPYEICRESLGQNFLTARPSRDLLTLLRSVDVS